MQVIDTELKREKCDLKKTVSILIHQRGKQAVTVEFLMTIEMEERLKVNVSWMIMQGHEHLKVIFLHIILCHHIIAIHTRHCAGQPIQFLYNETAAHSTGWWIVLPGIEAYYSNFKLQFIPHANLFELIIIPSSSLEQYKRSPCLLLFVIRVWRWKASLLSLSLPCQVLQHSSTHPIPFAIIV